MAQMTFGEWVRTTRETKRFGVMDCARRAEMAHSQWIRLEQDEPKRADGSVPQPTRKTVSKVALALDIGNGDALLAAGYAPPLDWLPQEANARRVDPGEDARLSEVAERAVRKVLEETREPDLDSMDDETREKLKLHKGIDSLSRHEVRAVDAFIQTLKRLDEDSDE